MSTFPLHHNNNITSSWLSQKLSLGRFRMSFIIVLNFYYSLLGWTRVKIKVFNYYSIACATSVYKVICLLVLCSVCSFCVLAVNLLLWTRLCGKNRSNYVLIFNIYWRLMYLSTDEMLKFVIWNFYAVFTLELTLVYITMYINGAVALGNSRQTDGLFLKFYLHV